MNIEFSYSYSQHSSPPTWTTDGDHVDSPQKGCFHSTQLSLALWAITEGHKKWPIFSNIIVFSISRTEHSWSVKIAHETFIPMAMEDMTGISDFSDKNRGVLGALHPTVIQPVPHLRVSCVKRHFQKPMSLLFSTFHYKWKKPNFKWLKQKGGIYWRTWIENRRDLLPLDVVILKAWN